MKKIVLAAIATVMMSATAMAQDDNQQAVRRERQPMDRTEMIQRRTDNTVKTYGLNEEQAAKLLELNKQYADKMGPRRGRFGNGRQGFRPERGARPDSLRRDQRPPRMQGNEGNREEMRKVFEAYDAELQKIMTEEQFKAYKDDQQKQFQNGRRGPRNDNRPRRDNDNN